MLRFSYLDIQKYFSRQNSVIKELTRMLASVYVLDIMTGKRMRQARKRLGMTQKEFGEALGVHGNSVARMERNEFSIIRTTELAVKFLLLRETKRKERRNE
jgi:DNA-binding XRE family transcriptional regulator